MKLNSSLSICLICPVYFNYQKLIYDSLNKKYNTVFLFDERPSNSFIVKSLLRLRFNFLMSFFIWSYYKKVLKEIIVNKVDTCLVINPETVPIWFLKKLKSMDVKVTLYMWDSFKNKKYAKKLIPFVNTAFTFDFFDSSNVDKVQYLPLFYDLSLHDSISKKGNVKIDISFVGTLHSDRYKIIKDIKLKALERQRKVFVYIYCQSKLLFHFKRLFFQSYKSIDVKDISFEPLSFNHYKEILKDSNVVLDIQHPDQHGLTMRAIECLGANKKIITTNLNITSYDFYNRSNIFVLERNSPSLNFDFLNEPYVKIDKEVYEKYSIDCWLEKLITQ